MRIASRLVGREILDRALKVGLVVLNPPLTAMVFVLAWRGEDTTPCLREASVSWKVTSLKTSRSHQARSYLAPAVLDCACPLALFYRATHGPVLRIARRK